MNLEQIADDKVRDEAVLAVNTFEAIVGTSGLGARLELVGTQEFLKIAVGRPAPLYDYALRELNRRLSDTHSFYGLIGLDYTHSDRFPASVEARALAALLARATRPVAQGRRPEGFSVPYVPFQNAEDHKVAQPATQLIVGRRGVGKSTLIMRAVELLSSGRDLSVVLDMQAYADLSWPAICREVLMDLVREFRSSARELQSHTGVAIPIQQLDDIEGTIGETETQLTRSIPELRRRLAAISSATDGQLYVFLDDFHLVRSSLQPLVLQALHGATKGANGWLKVAGLRSFLNYYDPPTRKGLQVPGDAQLVSLDLTLENPEAAERHLSAIMNSFMRAIGYQSYSSVLNETGFRRLVWANAGVPRDFLQMFARSLEHAQRSNHSMVTLSDINVSIGEFGQQKTSEMQQDARNEQNRLQTAVDYLVEFCLGRPDKRVNAFLVRTGRTDERAVIQALSDLRLVHLIHQSITPDRAGETYEAFILDYSLFTGFRRKRNIEEMLPDEGQQFRASALRQLPKLPDGFLDQLKWNDDLNDEGEDDLKREQSARSAKRAPRRGGPKRKEARSKAVKKRRTIAPKPKTGGKDKRHTGGGSSRKKRTRRT